MNMTIWQYLCNIS